MEAIKQKLRAIIVLTTFVLAIIFSVFILKPKIIRIDIKIIFTLLISAFISLLYLFIWEYKKYNKVKLIIDNEILNIKAASIEGNSRDSIEFIISCFGVLFGQNIIVFNVHGIGLKEIKISKNTMCITYGKDNKNEKINLLHKITDRQELQRISQKFQYETGIIPDISNGDSPLCF